MLRDYELIRLIRQIAGTYKSNTIEYYVAEVISIDKIKCLVEVLPITSKQSYLTDNFNLFFPFSEDTHSGGKYYEINNTDKIDWNNTIKNNTDNTIKNVTITAGGVSDGILIYPKIGSQVIVLQAQNQNPIIIQYSDIDEYHIITNPPNYKEFIINNDGIQINVSSESSINFKVNDGPQLILNNDEISLTLNNGTKIDIKESVINLKVNDGANILIDTKVNIKNDSENLKSILQDMLSEIQNLTVICAAPGDPSGTPIASNPSFLIDINDRINNLLE